MSGCATTGGSGRFENVQAEEITEEHLPKGSRVKLEVADGSTVRMTIAAIDEQYVYSTRSKKITKSEIRALTVLSWGDFGDGSSTTQEEVKEAAKGVGVEVLKAAGCLLMVIFADVDSDCS